MAPGMSADSDPDNTGAGSPAEFGLGQRQAWHNPSALERLPSADVNDLGVLDCRGSLQDTGSANVLINHGVQVFGLPQRILLEPEFEVLVM